MFNYLNLKTNAYILLISSVVHINNNIVSPCTGSAYLSIRLLYALHAKDWHLYLFYYYRSYMRSYYNSTTTSTDVPGILLFTSRELSESLMFF